MAKPRRTATEETATDSVVGARMLVVEARFYDDIANALLEGATGALKAAGATWDVISVPGSLEIAPRSRLRSMPPRRSAGPTTASSRSAA